MNKKAEQEAVSQILQAFDLPDILPVLLFPQFILFQELTGTVNTILAGSFAGLSILMTNIIAHGKLKIKIP